MRHLQTRRMQRLPLESVELLDKRGTGGRRKAPPPPVDGVPNNWIPDVRKMHADLMGTTALELYM